MPGDDEKIFLLILSVATCGGSAAEKIPAAKRIEMANSSGKPDGCWARDSRRLGAVTFVLQNREKRSRHRPAATMPPTTPASNSFSALRHQLRPDSIVACNAIAKVSFSDSGLACGF
jgi:hypothetical protein